MGSAAINFSDLPKGATVVSSQSGAYSDLPSGATVVEPPKGALERYWEGVKSAVPVLSGKSYADIASQQTEKLTNAHLPTWEEMKAAFQASPAGKMASGDVAGGLGAATPLAAMGVIGTQGERISGAAPALVRGGAKGINTAMDLAPAAGMALGSALAHDYVGGGWVAPAVGGVVGSMVGRAISALPRVPGENYAGQPAPTESMAPIPAGAYKVISQANPKLNDAQIRGIYQDYVKSTVDSRVPAGPINDAATKVAAAAPDAAHAQDVVAAAEKIAQSPQLSWEDILDDRAWAEKMRNAQQAEEQSYWTYRGRLNRAASSADVLKGSLTTPEQAVGSMPAPAGTMEANKLLGYQNRPTVAEATAIRNQALTATPQARPTVPLKDFVRMRYGTGTELKPAP